MPHKASAINIEGLGICNVGGANTLEEETRREPDRWRPTEVWSHTCIPLSISLCALASLRPFAGKTAGF
jgi:hypothetical protein